MAESALNYTLDDYQNEIAWFVGNGLLYANCTIEQQEQINRIITFAQNKFYTPIDRRRGMADPYKWSFIDIPTPWTLLPNVNFISDPTWKNYAISRITYNPQDSNSPRWNEIKIVNYADLMDMQNPTNLLTGPPQFAATTLGTYNAAIESPNWIVQFYPVPDKEYQIFVFQSIILSRLAQSTDNYQPAGYFHAETFMLCCKMVAAERFRSRSEYMERRQEYEERLQMSIEMDKRAKGGTFLGHIGNNPRNSWNQWKICNPNRNWNQGFGGYPWWGPPSADYINVLG